MAKKKKTREQKILADQRRKENPMPLYSLPQQVETSANDERKTVHTVTTTGYRYLAVDLRKTALLTAFIILIELLIRIFVKGV
ncbi:MAG TPA: hypothetical protein VE090_05190 [Methylomirabilota bacterium]|nr:hypothetical protein [Methylomirabilota bacterium]